METSPSSSALRVSGISSSARAVRTLSRAVPRPTLNWLANQEAADRWPSRLKVARRSISANRRSRSTSSCSHDRCSSAKSSSSRASGRLARTSDCSTSTTDLSSLTSHPPRTYVRILQQGYDTDS